MCGILCSVSRVNGRASATNLTTNDDLITAIAHRGPDSLQSFTVQAFDHELRFTASVLHLRGREVLRQPVIGDCGDVLCWNGEAWYGLDTADSDNDTTALYTRLSVQRADVPRVLENVRGPYACVYYQAQEAKLWYGRDLLGRRSMMHLDTEEGFCICSVGRRHESGWREVGTSGIICYNLKSRSTTDYSWTSKACPSSTELKRSYGMVRDDLPPSTFDVTDRHTPFYVLAVEEFEHTLREAIRVRTVTIPGAETDHGSQVAVMYSGGVDCAVIARLLNDYVPKTEPIDLINVSFENPRSIANARKLDASFDKHFDTPDRLTGLQGYTELCKTVPGREWRFVEVNVKYEEALAVKEEVLDLMFPNDSVMDYSIALAFYFCARGRGTLRARDETHAQAYTSSARVYFSGLGADEQLGGYSRHAAAWRRAGDAALVAELQLDLDRLPARNLGRDDRVLSRFARELRWPFLDEAVVAFLSDLRVDQKCCFALGNGGEKWLVRELGRRLGIPLASAEKKRAIQFGSRSARMEPEQGKAGHVKGHVKQV